MPRSIIDTNYDACFVTVSVKSGWTVKCAFEDIRVTTPSCDFTKTIQASIVKLDDLCEEIVSQDTSEYDPTPNDCFKIQHIITVVLMIRLMVVMKSQSRLLVLVLSCVGH